MNLADVVLLPRRQSGLKAEVGKTDDGVHGCANFMAHVGQKLALGLGRRLRLILGHHQSGFQILHGGDVGTDRNIFERFALLVEEGHDGCPHPVVLTIFGLIFHLSMPGTPFGDGFPHILVEF